MSWISELVGIYDKSSDLLDENLQAENGEYPLPIYHLTMKANVVVTIDQNGKFIGAENLELPRAIIPVDEEIVNKIKSLAFDDMVKNGGMSDGEEESQIIKSYIMTLPPEKRAAAGWTLNQISLQEADRLGEYVHQRDPSWNWGMQVKPGILDNYKPGTDILV